MRDLREQMHECKASQTRLFVWAETSGLAKELQKSRAEDEEREKTVVEAVIRKQLPRNPAQFIASGPIGKKIRISLARSGRRWPIKQSTKLRDIVAEAFKIEVMQLKLAEERIAQAASSVDNDFELRLQLRQEFEAADYNPTNKGQMLELFLSLQKFLARKEGRDPLSFNVDSFWAEFWDSVAEAFSDSVPRSGRDCQIHWTFYHHPLLNR